MDTGVSFVREGTLRKRDAHSGATEELKFFLFSKSASKTDLAGSLFYGKSLRRVTATPCHVTHSGRSFTASHFKSLLQQFTSD